MDLTPKTKTKIDFEYNDILQCGCKDKKEQKTETVIPHGRIPVDIPPIEINMKCPECKEIYKKINRIKAIIEQTTKITYEVIE